MKRGLFMKAIIITALLMTCSTIVGAQESTWVCMKAQKTIKVVGKTDKEKQADCKKQQGTWTEMPDMTVSDQKAGKGGGW
jgi:hypothetical protein